MKRSFLLSICLGIAAAVSTTWQTAATCVSRVYTVCARAVRWVAERVTAVFAKAQPLQAPRAAVLLVQAKAFVLRLAKRETPRVMPGWRMCPST